MCGITGILDRSGAMSHCALRTAIDSMTSALSHRGPDDHGVWIDDALPLGIGHRRLSILDISPSGHQPMISSTGRYMVTFNGEIYNYKTLQETLESKGHIFCGTSDTEVLLAAIEEWGVARAVERLDGMFAFGAWDRIEQVLSLARDRFGEKPLYYGESGPYFIFGSELRALEAFPGFDAAISRKSVSLLLKYGCIPAPHCIYEGVKKLEPASLLKVMARQEHELAPMRYWDARDIIHNARRQTRTGNVEDSVEELDHLLRKSVKSRMVSDVPIGAFLSGGIDSSIIVAMMGSVSSQPIKAFTIGFVERDYDESVNAGAVANHLGVLHIQRTLTGENAVDRVPTLAAVVDEPFADPSLLPTHLLCEMTREFVPVALSGDGGDELFGGYTRHVWAASIETWQKSAPAFARSIGQGLASRMSSQGLEGIMGVLRIFNRTAFDQRSPVTKLRKLARILRASESGDLVDHFVTHWERPADAMEDGPPCGPHLGRGDYGDLTSAIDRSMYADLVNYLPNDILVKVDRAAMNVSLETRVPFLNEDLLKFAWSLPTDLKVRGRCGKWILRQVLRRYVPDDLVVRPKSGFGLPLAVWLRGPLREWASALLEESSLEQSGLFRPEVVGKLWWEHLGERFDHVELLWPVLAFESWFSARREHHRTSGLLVADANESRAMQA